MAEYKVVDTQTLDAALSATANAIRAKGGSSAQVTWDNETGFASAVNGIQSGDSNEALNKLIDGTIASYSYPEGTSEVHEGTFCYRRNLDSIYIPDSVTKIGAYAFYSCAALSMPGLPESITKINGNAFCYCTNLALTKLPDNLISLGSAAFSNTAISIKTVPTGVERLQPSTFYACNKITEFIIPDTVSNIANQVFLNCEGLVTVTFEGTPTIVTGSPFQGCTNLATINVPWSEGTVAGAPWGATNATINYNYTGED